MSGSPIFTMTPVTQTTKYAGVRDDYIFDITYNNGDTAIDVSYTQLIAIIFPSNVDYVVYKSDCFEGAGSVIKVDTCWVDSTNSIIWVKPVVSSSYKNQDKLQIITRGLAIRNPYANYTNSNIELFTVKYYSWMNISQPGVNPRSDNNYCFLAMDSSTIPSSLQSFSLYVSGYLTPTYSYEQIPQQRYYK